MFYRFFMLYISTEDYIFSIFSFNIFIHYIFNIINLFFDIFLSIFINIFIILTIIKYFNNINYTINIIWYRQYTIHNSITKR